MSDSIDRVFVKAITTIRALSSRSNYGSLPRPPTENRIKLYGLYKQATEGNVQGIMSRPEGFTIEHEGAKKKWDAWKQEEGLSKTQAKRNYILYLIETMKVYASGSEARELLNELEYLWDQIKDIDFSDEDDVPSSSRIPYRYNIAPSVTSNLDQSDRISTGTPWPLRSSYSASVSGQQHRSNIEQIYSHSRRNNPLSVSEFAPHQRNFSSAKNFSTNRPTSPITDQATNSALGSDEFRAWQGQINSIINKLSKEFASHRNLGGVGRLSDSESEEAYSEKELLKKRVLYLLRTIGKSSLHFLKNMTISMFAMLFLVWCLNRTVIVQRTIVKKQLQGKSSKELVINMVINTDENKWFIRLLALINRFVGFV